MTTTRTRIDGASAALWASAFVLGGLIMVQAGQRPGSRAHAAMAIESEGFTLVTASSGRGPDAAPDEIIYVLSGRDEVLLAYAIEDARKKQILLQDAASLPTWFNNARR